MLNKQTIINRGVAEMRFHPKFLEKKAVFFALLILVFSGCSKSDGQPSSSPFVPVTLSVSDAQAVAGASPTQLVFTLSMSRSLDLAVSVNYATLDGTALGGTHFEAVSGTLSFPPGTTTQSVTVPVSPDTGICNAPKTMSLRLSAPSSQLKLAQSQAQGTIKEANQRSGALTQDETWSCVVNITGNTSVSGAKIRVTPGGGIQFAGDGLIFTLGAASDGSASLVLQGSAEQPVVVSTASGHSPGYFTTANPNGGMSVNYAKFNQVGDAQHPAIGAQLAASGALVVQNSSFTSSGEIQITSEDQATSIQIQGNDIRQSQGTNAVSINLYGNTHHLIDSNTMDGGVFINTYGTPGATISNNVLVGAASIAAYGNGIAVTGNYIHETSGPSATAALQIEAQNSTVSGNYVRGGYWSIFAEGTGGIFENNIFESTSEITNQIIIASMPSGSLWKGNILRGQSVWEAAWIDSANQITFRNNVIDVISSVGVWMNRSGAQNNTINFRNNVVMGVGTGIYDQPGAKGDLSYADFNGFFNIGSADYSNINIPGLVLGTGLGFGGHDVHADPMFTNRAVALSLTDVSLMARAASSAAALAEIQAGYKPLSGSPLVGAGDPQDDGDPDVTDGSRDIGAIQR